MSKIRKIVYVFDGAWRKNLEGKKDVYWEGYWIPITTKRRRIVIDDEVLSGKLRKIVDHMGIKNE